jgi:hypothetical protein
MEGKESPAGYSYPLHKYLNTAAKKQGVDDDFGRYISAVLCDLREIAQVSGSTSKREAK